MVFHQGPFLAGQSQDGDFPASDVLLVTEVLVAGDECIELCILSGFEQHAILQAIPSEISGSADIMTRQMKAQSVGQILVEQHLHEAESS